MAAGSSAGTGRDAVCRPWSRRRRFRGRGSLSMSSSTDHRPSGRRASDRLRPMGTRQQRGENGQGRFTDRNHRPQRSTAGEAGESSRTRHDGGNRSERRRTLDFRCRRQCRSRSPAEGGAVRGVPRASDLTGAARRRRRCCRGAAALFPLGTGPAGLDSVARGNGRTPGRFGRARRGTAPQHRDGNAPVYERATHRSLPARRCAARRRSGA